MPSRSLRKASGSATDAPEEGRDTALFSDRRGRLTGTEHKSDIRGKYVQVAGGRKVKEFHVRAWLGPAL